MKNIKQKIVATVLLLLCTLTMSAFEVDGISYSIREGRYAEVTNGKYCSGDVIIPNKVVYEGNEYVVESIGNYAFNGCTSLTSVEIPNSVESIGGSAFSKCTSLTSVEIPNSVESVGNYAFSECTSLASVNLPNSVVSIGKWAFSSCTSLASVNLPNSLRSIELRVFYGCTSLTSVEIPNSVESIGGSAFYGCTSLASVNLPNSLKSIEEYAFQNCTSLASVNLPNSLKSIERYAFDGCTSLTLVEIPNSVESIGSMAFRNCTSLASVNLPNSLKTIESWTFYKCENLTSIEIPNSVTTIGESAFYGCSAMQAIVIGQSVDNIGINAFYIDNHPEITCLAPVPPVLYDDGYSWNRVFRNYDNLHVYEGFKEAYLNAGGEWSKFNIIDDIEVINATGVVLDKEQYRCVITKTGQAIATTTNDDATFRRFSWESSDSSIVSIDSKTGEFQGLQLGQALITATALDGGGASASAVVRVEEPILATSLAFGNTEYIVESGQAISLSPVITPEDADEKTFEWTTSNENIATVADGVVKGVNGGVATITAKTTDGSNLSASCTVVVDGPLYDYNCYLESSYTGMYSISQAGSRVQKSIEIYIENKGTESITISQVKVKRIGTDEIVATLTDAGATGQLKAGERKETSFTIYEDAPLEDFYYEWSYRYNYHDCVKVSKDYVPVMDVTSVTINVETATMQVEDTKNLAATVHPSIAMDKTVTWTSSAPDIAEVTSTGTVTAKAVGEADITAESHNGKTAVCHIVVEPTLIESISITSPKSEIGVGEEVSFTAVVVPEKATDKTVIWSSSDENVATVSADGVVAGIAIGKAMITAKAADGSIARATVPVTVVQNVELLTFDTKTMILGQGETATIGVTIAPDNARNKTLEWTTSDKNIATVKDGVVTALEGGVATITAKTTDGSNLSASCTVVVDAPPYDYNNFLSSACTGQYSRTQFGSIVKMAIGFYIENKGSESINITKVNVRRNSNNALILSSTDASLLGQLKAGQRKELEFTINEDASIWGFHYEWYYTYNGHECMKDSDEPAKKIDVYAITLDEESITMRDGETKTLSTKVYPNFATEKTITWTSSDTDVATVSTDGKVTATGVGEADIYATAKSGVSAVCHVVVETTPVESIKVVAKKTEIEVDEQVVFTASILPVNATAKTVIWSSSNEDVATVSAKGAVVGIAPGKTTITAEATDGSGMKDSVEVTVVLSNGIEYITLDDDNMKVYDTNGIEFSGTKRGVNIIKTTNGTTRKVIKK